MSAFPQEHDLRALLTDLPGGRDLAHDLPGARAPLRELAEEAVRALIARNMIDDAFFAAILARRPSLLRDIRTLAEATLGRAAFGLERRASTRELGEKVGRWNLHDVLGSGAYGIVYGATDIEGHAAAVKVHKQRLDPVEEAHAQLRFRRGPDALRIIEARGVHPHIVRLIEGPNLSDGVLWYAMQRIEGPSVRKGRQRLYEQSMARILDFFSDIVSALTHAHSVPLFHRDLKPENILMVQRERLSAVLCDFDLARAEDSESLTRTQALVGTLAYLPPEHREAWGGGDEYTWIRPDERARDLWALGMTLQYILTGRESLDSRGLSGQRARALDRVEGGHQINSFIGWLINDDPNERPSDCEEVRERLSELRVSLGRSIHAVPSSAPPPVHVVRSVQDERQRVDDLLSRFGSSGQAAVHLTQGVDELTGDLIVHSSVSMSEVIAALSSVSLGVRLLRTVQRKQRDRELAHVQVQLTGLPNQLPDPALRQVAEVIELTLGGHLDVDELNSLCWKAGLPWRALRTVRAYVHFLAQLRPSASVDRAKKWLVERPAVAASFMERFRARFEPRRVEAGVEQTRKADWALPGSILFEDESLFFDALPLLADATTRTNAYHAAPSRAIALKFDGSLLALLTPNFATVETFVFSAIMEGVHLRSSPISRGGVRQSARLSYRDEGLDLLQIQNLKNTAVVPDGAKGVFILRRHSEDARQQWQLRERALTVYLDALLDITDSIAAGQVVPAQGVVAHDGPDPYLVVAADKGTADLAAVANRISAERKYWLGDAFATGGDDAFRHKSVGVTSRVAWVFARHHLRWLGVDTGVPLTCVGIGDPAGDVFGNAMIEQENLLLIGAFNHNYIFIDPNPDSLLSSRERHRLFALAQSWDFYSASAISAGGGVYSRRSRVIPLSPEARHRLGTTSEELPPNEVIKLLLMAEVDILLSAGVGTYVKSTDESHHQVGDPSNDFVRVNGADLKCRVVSEGANRGLTHRGRLEAAGKGVRVNADFVDSMGGVALSDREVNSKLLLLQGIEQGHIARAERDPLLFGSRDDILEAVLRSATRRAQQLDDDERRSRVDVEPFVRLRTRHEQWLARQNERYGVGSTVSAAARFHGLLRPEIAMLACLEIRRLRTELMMSWDWLGIALPLASAYFPPMIRERLGGAVAGFPLVKALGACMAVEAIVALKGTTFVSERQIEGLTAGAAIAQGLSER